MARNGSGVMSVLNTFLPSTTISSSAVNANFSDIATEITNSVPRDGQAGMSASAQLKLQDGTASAPGIAWISDLNTGFYRSGTDEISIATGGTQRVKIDSAGKLSALAALDVAGACSFVNSSLVLTLRDSTNDTSERELIRFALGSGAGNKASIRATGAGANDVTTLHDYIASTEVARQTATLLRSLIAHQFGSSGLTIDPSGFANLPEISAPASPSADNLRLYALDSGGTTVLSQKDSGGTARVLPGVATQAEMEAGTSLLVASTPGRQQHHPLHAKAMALVGVSGGGVPSLSTSVNVSSVTDGGTGILTINIDTDFSSATWVGLCTIQAVGARFIRESAKAAGSVTYEVANVTPTATDPDVYNFVGLGDQA